MPHLPILEQTFNGPIPPAALAVARHGSPEMVALIQADGQRAFFAGMVRGQVRAIRGRRADGSFYPALIDDLAMYRRQFRGWNRLAHALRRTVDAQLAERAAPATLAA